jgi:hypothetical protein
MKLSKWLVAACVAVVSFAVAAPVASAGGNNNGSSQGTTLCKNGGWARNFLPRYANERECLTAAKNGTLRPQYFWNQIPVTGLPGNVATGNTSTGVPTAANPPSSSCIVIVWK